MKPKINYYILIPKTRDEMSLDRLEETMNTIIERNKEFTEQMRRIKIIFDNSAKVITEYMYENRFKIFKELIEENNKIVGN